MYPRVPKTTRRCPNCSSRAVPCTRPCRSLHYRAEFVVYCCALARHHSIPPMCHRNYPATDLPFSLPIVTKLTVYRPRLLGPKSRQTAVPELGHYCLACLHMPRLTDKLSTGIIRTTRSSIERSISWRHAADSEAGWIVCLTYAPGERGGSSRSDCLTRTNAGW